MSTSWEFAHNLAQVSTGLRPPWEPEVSITHVEQGVYKLSIDRESIALTAQDLLDIMDWCLLRVRELSQQADMASIPPLVAPDETPEDWKIREYEDTRTYMEHHYLGGE